MQVKDGYLLKEIDGADYLLPYGQNIATHKHGLLLNKTSLFLYEQLKQNTPVSELPLRLMEYFGLSEDSLPEVTKDVHSFLGQLLSYGILEPCAEAMSHRLEEASEAFPASLYFSIADFVIEYSGPAELIHSSFWDFSCAPQKARQKIAVHSCPPPSYRVGAVLIRTAELTILQNDSFYTFLFDKEYLISEIWLRLDGSYADIYCPAACREDFKKDLKEDLKEDLFHAIRFVFLVKAQMEGYFALHSASLIYQEKVWLFSAPSGTGKSTHTNLWNRLFGTEIFNGDLNLLSIADNVPTVHGIPWCGTSSIYHTGSYPLGGIILLHQSPSNEFLTKNTAQKVLGISKRLISPTWTEEQLLSNLNFAELLVAEIPVFFYGCNISEEAAAKMKKEIDQLERLS